MSGVDFLISQHDVSKMSTILFQDTHAHARGMHMLTHEHVVIAIHILTQGSRFSTDLQLMAAMMSRNMLTKTMLASEC